MKIRTIAFMGDSQKVINNWPENVEEIIKFNLQALQCSLVSGFSNLPDWANQGKVTDKKLKGNVLEGARQLTVKDKDSYRVVYVAEYQDKVYVIHAFKKKTEGVDKKAMNTVEARMKQLKDYLAD